MSVDLARLGFDIDPERNALRGTRDLKGLEQQSIRTEQATDRLGRTSRTAGDDIGRTGQSAEAASANFRRAAVAAGAFAAAIGGAAAASRSFNDALQLDAAIGELSTLLPGATRDLEAMTAAAREFAAEFGTTQTEQVRAFYQAVSAGASDAQAAIELMEASNRLAVGGVTSVTTAVDILTTATNAYAEQGLTAADAADILFTGVRAGKTTVEELAATLGRAIPAAAALGVGFDEVVASTAALTTQGQDTALAVTGLAGAMSQLLNPSQQARELAAEIGLEFSAAGVRAHGFAGFMEEVVRATGGSQEMMAELFGSIEALRAVLVLAGGGADSLSATLEMMEGRAGAADRAFAEIDARISQQWNTTVSEAANLTDDFGRQLSRVLVPAASEVVAVLTDAEDASLALEVAMKGATVAAGAFAAINGGRVVASAIAGSNAFRAYAVSVGLVGPAAATATAATSALTVATRTLLGPVGLAVTAVGALTAAWVLAEPPVDRLRARYADLYDELDRLEGIQQRMSGLNLQRARELLAEAEAAQAAADAEAELAIERQRARVAALQSATEAPSLGGRDSANRQADLRRLAEAQEELNRLEGESFQRRAELAGATEELRAEVQSLLAAERVRDRERRETSDQTRRLTREERERRDEIAATRAEILQEIEDLTRLEAAMQISERAHDALSAEIERENEVRALGIDLTSSLGQEMLEELRVRDQLRDSIDDITEARDKEIRALEEQKDAVREAAREMERQVDSATRTATKLATQVFEDDWEAALDNVGDMIAEWALRNLVFEPIIRPIFQGGGLSVSPNGGISIGGVGGLGGLGGIGQGGIGNGFGLFGALNGIGGNIGTSLGSFLGNSAINLGAGANTAQFLANAGLRIGNASPYALLGSVLGNAFGLSGSGNGFVDAGLNLGGAVAGQALGGSLSFLGAAGGPIGAILGSLLGQGLGSLFADKDYPYARGDIRIQNGQAVVTGTETLDGASDAEVRAASQAIADTINAALGMIGASGNFGGGTTFGQSSGRSTALGSGFFAGADGGFNTGATWTRVEDPEQAAAQAVAFAMAQAISDGAIDLPEAMGGAFEAVMAIFERNAYDLDKSIADINFAQNFEDTLLALEGSVLSFSETIEGQARAQIEAALGPLDDFLSKTAELGLDTERAGDAVETYVRSLLGLTESESLNAAQANLDIINAQFDALADSVTRFGISAEEVEQGRQIALDNARQSFADQVNAALLQATGRGHVLEGEQLLAQIAELEAQAEVYGVAFEDVDALSRALVTNLLADLDASGIEEVRAIFGAAADEYADLFEAALAGTLQPIEDATRTVEDFLSEVERATLEMGGRGFILDAREIMAQAEAWRADAEQFGVGMDEVNQFARAALADILRSLEIDEIEALRADMGAQARQYADLFEAALAGLLDAVADPAETLADFIAALEADIARLEGQGPATAIRAIGDELRAGLEQAGALGADTTLLYRRAFLQLGQSTDGLDLGDFDAVRDALAGLPVGLNVGADAIRSYMDEIEALSVAHGAAAAAAQAAALAERAAASQRSLLDAVYDYEAALIQEQHQQSVSSLEAQIRLAQDAYDLERSNAEERARSLQQEADLLARASDQIADFSRSLVFSSSSPIPLLEQLQKAQANFDATFAAARGGDAEAAGRLTEDAQRLLELNAEVNRSGVAGADLFADVQARLRQAEAFTGSQADSLASQADRALDVSRSQLDALQAQLDAIQGQSSTMEAELAELRALLGISETGFEGIEQALAAAAEAAARQGLTMEEYLAQNQGLADLLAGRGFEGFAAVVAEAFAAVDREDFLSSFEERAQSAADRLAEALAASAADIAVLGPEISDGIDEVAEGIISGGASVSGAIDGFADIVAGSAQAYSDYVTNALAQADLRLSNTVAANDSSNARLLERVEQLIAEVAGLRSERQKDADREARLSADQLDRLHDVVENTRSNEFLTWADPSGRLSA